MFWWLLRRVVMMGGAVSTYGNCTTHAESNVWHDPEAADTVLAAGLPLTLVGLDFTRQAPATVDWISTLAQDTNSLWGQYAAFLLHQHEDDVPLLPLHNPLAASLLVCPNLAECTGAALQVDLAGDTRGRTTHTTDPHRPTVTIATAVNADQFRTILASSLAPNTPDPTGD